jgi:hypothetical protein
MSSPLDSEPVSNIVSFVPPDITPEKLIGSKWIASGTNSNTKDTIEFVDRIYCVYTSIDRLEPYTYRIRGNRIILGDFVTYVFINDILFLNGYPLFTRERG